MQYCDGNAWQAMGQPDPAGPVTGCTNPAGIGGNLIYNNDYCTMQYCDGSDWKAIPDQESDPCACGTVTPGTVCADGTIYAGLSPDGNVRMFTTAADAPGGTAYTWNNGNSSGASMVFVTADPCYFGGEAGCKTGALNTADAAVADSDSSIGGVQPHPAVLYCANLDSNTHTDWYLPAQEELEVLFGNRTAGNLSGTFDTVNGYWSSSEVNNVAVIFYSDAFPGGNNSTKENVNNVRCVRK